LLAEIRISQEEIKAGNKDIMAEMKTLFSSLTSKQMPRGPLSLVSTTEELLDRKVAAPA
jgi:hypothetical protein